MANKTIRFDNTDKPDLEQWNKAVGAFREWKGKGEIVIRRPIRTQAQNNSLHLYCDWLSAELNELDKMFVVQTLQIEDFWTPEFVKEKLFKRVLKAVCGKEKTSSATTAEISKTVDILEKNLSLKLGIDLAFPNKWDLHWNKQK